MLRLSPSPPPISHRSAGLRRGKQLGGLSPAERSCHAVGVWVTVPGMDAWCHTNCLAEPMPSCPEGMCQCGEAGSAPPRPSLQLLRGSLPRRPLPATAGQLSEADLPPPRTGELPSPLAVAETDTVQALLTELARLREERLRYQAAHSGSSSGGGGGRLPTSSQLTYLAPEDAPAASLGAPGAGVAVTRPRRPLRPFYFAPATTTQRTAPLTEPPPVDADGVERFPPPQS